MMATIPKEITINIGVRVSDDIALRCLRILEMWMDDNPHKTIICDTIQEADCFRHRISIKEIGGMKNDFNQRDSR